MTDINRRKSYIQRIIYLNTYAADLRCNCSGEYMLKKYDEAVIKECSLHKRFKDFFVGMRILDFSVPLVVDLAAMGAAVIKIAAGTLSVGSFTSTIKASRIPVQLLRANYSIANRINGFALYSRKLQVSSMRNLPSNLQSSYRQRTYRKNVICHFPWI